MKYIIMTRYPLAQNECCIKNPTSELERVCIVQGKLEYITLLNKLLISETLHAPI